jgi:hypothetical protein
VISRTRVPGNLTKCQAVPSLNIILKGSDADVECELSGSCA